MNDNFIEIEDFDIDSSTNDKNDRQINGKPLFYTTSQVASILDETDSKIRHWCLKFKDVLHIETSGSHRRFSEENITQLKYIKELLQVDKLSIKQAVDVLKEKEEGVVEKKISENNPIVVKAMATAISMSVKSVLEEVLHDFEVRQERKSEDDLVILETILKETQQERFSEFKEVVEKSIGDKIEYVEKGLQHIDKTLTSDNSGENLSKKQEDIYKEVEELKKQLELQNKIALEQNELLKEQNRKAEERDRLITEQLKQSLEKKEEQSKKGLFSRIFNK